MLDGEEIDQTISWKRVINDTGDGSHGTYCIYFNMLSDPTKVDTDGDGLCDNSDPKPNDQDNNGNDMILSFGSDGTLAQLQRWLVALGYLNMRNNPYGELYGPITRTAVYMYQINHCFRSTSEINGREIALENIDDLTYATIANEYANIFGNGKSDYINYVSGISQKPYFESIEITPIALTETQSECGIRMVKKDNSIIKSEFAEVFDLYYYDYNEPINSKLAANLLYIIHFIEVRKDIVPDSTIANLARAELINKVRPNGDWDYKLLSSWEKEFDTIPYMTISFPFVFRGDFCSAEKFGNINYGYIGRAMGFSADILVTGGHVVSFITGFSLENEDDVNNVLKGCEYYESDIVVE